MENRVYCLYRVSTTKQVDHDDQNQADIPMQRIACREFAERMGWSIICEEQEAGISGYKISAADRSVIQRFKADAEKKKFDILLVYMFDRLGRKDDETPFVVQWFVDHGIKVWSVKEGEQRFDSHVDYLTNYIRFWQASGESKKTSIRTKTALGQMVQEGRFRGGSAPYGYRLEPSGILNKRKHEVYKLVIDESEAEVVQLIYRLYVESGYGRYKISTYLNEHGLKNRAGLNWHDATVGHILHNVMYMGILRSGETSSTVFKELQIISENIFNKVQVLMAERANDYKGLRTMPRTTRGQSLLSGNVFCGHCGGRLTLTTNGTVHYNANSNRTDRKRIRYVCYNKTRKRAECDGQTGYTMSIVDGMVSNMLRQVFAVAGSYQEQGFGELERTGILETLHKRVEAAQADYQKMEQGYGVLKEKAIKAAQERDVSKAEMLTELTEAAYSEMIAARQALYDLKDEYEKCRQEAADVKNMCEQIVEWSKHFEVGNIAVRKMIAGYIIETVHIRTGYRMTFKFRSDLTPLGLTTKEMERSTKHNGEV